MENDFVVNEFMGKRSLSMKEKEINCRKAWDDTVLKLGPVWHMCTPGDGMEIIFTTGEDYKYGMLVIWMATCLFPRVHIFTFILMNNHVHILLAGDPTEIRLFFELIKKRLRRYLLKRGRTINLDKFDYSDLIPIEKLETFRNTVAYINRNNYVVDPMETPFSYPYGAGAYFFNPFAKKLPQKKFGSLSITARRELLGTHDIDYPVNALMLDGYVSPISFCEIQWAETLFRDAHQYFYTVSRNIESGKELSELLKNEVYYTDDELFAAACKYSREMFSESRLSLLGITQKTTLARKLHFEYNAGNKQLARILRLDPSTVNALFPK